MEKHKKISDEIVVSIYSDLESLGVTIWIDGGWGVDALLRQQTRPHGDVDFVVQEKDLATLDAYLREREYIDVPRDDTRAWNYVLGNSQGNEVDIHVININESGDGVYGPPENCDEYPAPALGGIGSIISHEVKCISAEYQIMCRVGYKLREIDYKDVSALCVKFGMEIPKSYAQFVK